LARAAPAALVRGGRARDGNRDAARLTRRFPFSLREKVVRTTG
jgi:hypothetical protein